MIKIKFASFAKEKIRQMLLLDDSLKIDLLISDDVSNVEPDCINLILPVDQIEDLVTWLQYYKKASGNKLIGRNARGESMLALAEVIYIESFGNDVIATLAKGEYYLQLKLYQLEEELASEGFLRISKSMIINVAHVESIYSGFNGKIVLNMTLKKTVEVNRSYTKAFKAYLKERK